MTDATTDRSPARAWWLALAALTICAPWPGWEPNPGLVALLVVLLLVLARPRGRERWSWLGVACALAGAIVPVADGVQADRLSRGLDDHCRGMLATAAAVVEDQRLTRLFAATGEAQDPNRPFEILASAARQVEGRTVYLADDRGQLLAWGGDERGFPVNLRPIGPRVWGIEWSATRGVLYLREPLMIEGRIVGTVTVADRGDLRQRTAWGMDAPGGRRLTLGRFAPGAIEVASEVAPGVVVSVGSEPIDPADRRALFCIGWLVVVASGLIARPGLAVAGVAVGAAFAGALPSQPTGLEQMVLVLSGAAAVSRFSMSLPDRWSRSLIGTTIAVAVAMRLAGPLTGVGSWLPEHLLRPGWGGVWMIALAWLATGWPTVTRRRFDLERRAIVASGLAILGLAVDLAWYPVRIVDVDRDPSVGVELPRGAVSPGDIWPSQPESCRLDDAAPVLASAWGLDRWSTPARLSVVDADGLEVSSWGDLSPADDKQRLLRTWPIGGVPWLRIELDVATQPWSFLGDWASGDPLEDSWNQPVWYAVLTRSGAVAATLHPEIQDLDPVIAGEAYHAGAVWTGIGIGDGRLPARVVRRGEWLVAMMAHPPAPSVWVVRTALAVVWALLGMLLARPPVLRREELATFGGRLRLLVAGGVVIPLVILTLFLQLRLGREEARLEEVLGGDALEAGRYTVEHLGEGTVIDDQLAAWLARGWGGEVIFFDRTDAVGVSRPDLMSVRRLAQLPAVEAYPGYLLGRSDTVISHRPDWLAASGTVVVDGRRYLLQLFRSDPLRSGDAPDAADWLLTGALLAALVAIIATARIEERLSTSLRDLVDLARRLVRGEPVGPLHRPKETDLAEVLDAVRSMNEEVRRREMSLRHQEELLRITLANLTPAVMVLEPDGEVSFANPSAEALLEEHGDLVDARIAAVAADVGEANELAVTIQPYPGRDLTWRVGVAGVPLPDGRNGLVAVIDDVTEVVRLDRLQQLNQLARIVAHEVKNPLTPIRLWVQELDEARRRGAPDLPDLLEEACGEISTQVHRLQDTASSFSNLVALEHWQPEDVDLTEMISAIPGGLGVLARRGISVVLDLPAPGSALVTADRPWLARALTNLVQNSLDALGDGPGEIRMSVSVEGERVRCEIEDTGGGVAGDQLKDLFSPHFSTTASGSGLGLALV
ncbi:MAG: ATP-binding protein, partial [Candidatus Sulfomarinibacteraceae bacterium]